MRSQLGAVALLITLVLSACTVFTAPPPEAQRGMLTEVPPEPPRSGLYARVRDAADRHAAHATGLRHDADGLHDASP